MNGGFNIRIHCCVFFDFRDGSLLGPSRRRRARASDRRVQGAGLFDFAIEIMRLD